MTSNQYTYDENIVSDLYKDAYNTRPTENWWIEWNNKSNDEKQDIWNKLLVALAASIDEDEKNTAWAINHFEKRLANDMWEFECDRETALRKMTENAEFRGALDVEHWVWEQGFLNSKMGEALVRELNELYGFENE